MYTCVRIYSSIRSIYVHTYAHLWPPRLDPPPRACLIALLLLTLRSICQQISKVSSTNQFLQPVGWQFHISEFPVCSPGPWASAYNISNVSSTIKNISKVISAVICYMASWRLLSEFQPISSSALCVAGKFSEVSSTVTNCRQSVEKRADFSEFAISSPALSALRKDSETWALQSLSIVSWVRRWRLRICSLLACPLHVGVKLSLVTCTVPL